MGTPRGRQRQRAGYLSTTRDAIASSYIPIAGGQLPIPPQGRNGLFFEGDFGFRFPYRSPPLHYLG